jgi:glucose-1-phosphate adenylyltransferase
MMGSDAYQSLKEIEINKDKILMGVGENCHIENAIIDKNCCIGNSVTLIGGTHLPNQENDLLVVSGGIIVVKKEVTIPHGYTLK